MRIGNYDLQTLTRALRRRYAYRSTREAAARLERKLKRAGLI